MVVSKENSAKSVEKDGERFRVSLQSTTVYTGGGQLLPEGARRENSGVISNFPSAHIFILRRLRRLLPRSTMMATERGRDLDGTVPAALFRQRPWHTRELVPHAPEEPSL